MCVCVCACVCVLRRRLSGQGCLRPGDSPAPSSRGHPANWSNWSKRKLPRIIMIALYYIIIRTGLLPVRGLAGSLPSSRNETVVSPDRRRRVSRWTPPPAAATARGKYWSNWYCWSNTGQTGIAGQILVKTDTRRNRTQTLKTQKQVRRYTILCKPRAYAATGAVKLNSGCPVPAVIC